MVDDLAASRVIAEVLVPADERSDSPVTERDHFLIAALLRRLGDQRLLQAEGRPEVSSQHDLALRVQVDVVGAFLEALRAGASVLDKLDPDEAARLGTRAAADVLASAKWAQVVGDRLNTTQVTQMLGVTRQALNKRQQSGSLLGLAGDGTTWFPTWQFDLAEGRIRPEVRDVIGGFRDHLDDVDPMLIASWATTNQHDDLAGETPAQWLRTGRDPAQLRRAAERAAARLAR